MAKIITLTFNPVIDKTSTVERIAPEKKLRCGQPHFGPGGGGINVSRALKNLGHSAPALYPAGGHSGRFLKDLMDIEGLESMIIETEKPTRENFIVLDTSCNQQYRFGFPGEEMTSEEQQALLQKIEMMEYDFLVASGSLMPGMSPDFVGAVARIARRKNAKLILDTSGKTLKKSLEAGVYLLKPNLGELSSLVGKEEVGIDEVDEISKDIINKGQCAIIVVSMGAQGARLISAHEVFHARAPIVKKVSTLGAGDSMVAGMVLMLSEQRPLREVIKYGVACGTAATLTHGSELCRKEDVERLLNRIVVTED
ncbi:MAG: 1-phosphofructokinase family hexose kinase [Flavisolibacter sp.]|jgi:6-phosphofructokinase 2|nr:1-phosphofructokinase family hexose kinase [Flavisolibacter sp.]